MNEYRIPVNLDTNYNDMWAFAYTSISFQDAVFFKSTDILSDWNQWYQTNVWQALLNMFGFIKYSFCEFTAPNKWAVRSYHAPKVKEVMEHIAFQYGISMGISIDDNNCGMFTIIENDEEIDFPNLRSLVNHISK